MCDDDGVGGARVVGGGGGAGTGETGVSGVGGDGGVGPTGVVTASEDPEWAAATVSEEPLRVMVSYARTVPRVDNTPNSLVFTPQLTQAKGPVPQFQRPSSASCSVPGVER